MQDTGRDPREAHPALGKRQCPCLREGCCPLCFQDSPVAEKESKVLSIVSVGLTEWGGGGWRWEGAQAQHPLPQCSHVAGICQHILSCSPQELLEQRAVLERVQLDDLQVSSGLGSLAWALKYGCQIPQDPVLLWLEGLFCTAVKGPGDFPGVLGHKHFSGPEGL